MSDENFSVKTVQAHNKSPQHLRTLLGAFVLCYEPT